MEHPNSVANVVSRYIFRLDQITTVKLKNLLIVLLQNYLAIIKNGTQQTKKEPARIGLFYHVS